MRARPTFSPVVPRPGAAHHDVLLPEEPAQPARPDGVHHPGLQVGQDGPGHPLSLRYRLGGS